MNYRNYVIAAYAVFVVVMLWDCVSPWLQLRAERLRAERATARTKHTGSLPSQG